MSSNLQLTQLQPMRMFEWVNLFVFILLACAVPKAWEAQRPLGALLLAVITLNILGSLWGLAALYLAIAVFAARWLARQNPNLAFAWSPVVSWAAMAVLAVAAAGMWMVGSSRAESLRDPVPIVLVFLIVAAAWLTAWKPGWRWAGVTAALAIALMGRSVYVHAYSAERRDADFESACRWIAASTPTDARFITAVTGKDASNFRARSLRTSLNESQSALFWVAPRVGVDNEQAAQQVQDAWNGQEWDMGTLRRLAEEWHATYVLVDADVPNMPVLFQDGRYRVLKMP